MAKPIDVQVTNTVPDAARAATSALRAELADALANSARDVVRGAQRSVPVLTGSASSSLRLEPADSGARIVAGGVRAPYFHILEYGSKFVRGGHHIGRAVGMGMSDIEKAAAGAVEEAAGRGGFRVG